jgi:hypothetical protein
MTNDKSQMTDCLQLLAIWRKKICHLPSVIAELKASLLCKAL